MNGRAYYNEIDDFMADWLEGLIEAGRIAPGVVDRRSVIDLVPAELADYTQVHLFAGLGGWSAALRGAGWPDDRQVWTWSEPCQPFSAAGKGLGFADERYLRPFVHHLVSQCRPATAFGEQVASKDGLAWRDVIQSDMEGEDYAFWCPDICSAGFGAPHIRQRLYWCAELMGNACGDDMGWFDRGALGTQAQGEGQRQVDRNRGVVPGSAGAIGVMADGSQQRRREECPDAGRIAGGDRTQGQPAGLVHGGSVDRLDDAAGARQDGPQQDTEGKARDQARLRLPSAGRRQDSSRPGPTNGFWSNPDWLYCRDGKWRPVEPGTFPLAHGLPRGLGTCSAELRRLAEMAGLDGKSLARAKAYRVGTLGGYGNAINIEQATEFVRIYLETESIGVVP